ncbi:MAG: hypothetical protein ACLFUS_12430 [Candidatus Sumerlaeia bacterium]
MPFSDPEKRRLYQREYRRKKRQQQAQQAAKQAVEQCAESADEPAQGAPQDDQQVPSSVSDVQSILGAEMVAIRASGLDRAIVARVVSTLANSWLKAAEVGELENRIEALECRTAGPEQMRKIL